MISVVSLNPAIDKTCSIGEIIPGQVNRMETVLNLAGGKGINVAKVLRQYGYPVRVLGFLGGATGGFIEAYAKKIGCTCCFTKIHGETRVNTNILGADGKITELLEPGPVILEAEEKDFLDRYEACLLDSTVVILSGSVPGGIPSDIYEQLIERAKTQQVKVLLDTSGELLKRGVQAGPYFVKPNGKELTELCGKELTENEICTQADQLRKLGIKDVMVSLGAEGLYYLTENQLLFAASPKIPVCNTVGSGDSVVAAYAIAGERKLNAEDTLRFCVSVATANVTTKENAVIPMDLQEAIFSQIEIQQKQSPPC